jgi:hypothetical protein
VLQNIYIHDFDGEKFKENFPEAIGIASGGDGIVFNCFVEYWTAKNPGEAIFMAVMHHRSDNAYGEGHVTRVERCKVKNGLIANRGWLLHQMTRQITPRYGQTIYLTTSISPPTSNRMMSIL